MSRTVESDAGSGAGSPEFRTRGGGSCRAIPTVVTAAWSRSRLFCTGVADDHSVRHRQPAQGREPGRARADRVEPPARRDQGAGCHCRCGCRPDLSRRPESEHPGRLRARRRRRHHHAHEGGCDHRASRRAARGHLSGAWRGNGHLRAGPARAAVCRGPEAHRQTQRRSGTRRLPLRRVAAAVTGGREGLPRAHVLGEQGDRSLEFLGPADRPHAGTPRTRTRRATCTTPPRPAP